MRSSLAPVLALSLLATRIDAQNIELVDQSGDGQFPLLIPKDVVVDDRDNVYVMSSTAGNVLRVSPDGVVTNVFDPAGTPLNAANGMAVDAAGNLYLTGFFSDNAIRVTPAGVVTEILDASGDGAGNVLDVPEGIAVDAAGNVYVVGGVSNNVFEVEPDGTITEILDATGGPGTGALLGPRSVDVDAAGNVYVTANSSDNVFKVEPDGTITEILDATGDGNGNTLDGPAGIVVDDAGVVYVAGRLSDNAFSVTPGGVVTELVDASGAGPGAALDQPTAIDVDSSGRVVLTGAGSNNAFRISPDGTVVELIDASGDGGNPLDQPEGIAVDASGHAYVSGANSFNLFFSTPQLFPVFAPASGCGEVTAATAGVPLTLEITASDSPFNDLLLVQSSALPPGATLSDTFVTGNPVSTTFDWTPTQADVGTHTFTVSVRDQFFALSVCFVIIEVAECFLLVGAAPGSEPVAAGGHTFATQLSNVTAAYPVTTTDYPEFALGKLGRGSSSPLAAPAAAPLVPIPLGGRGAGELPLVPGQLFFVQVVMWNPEAFPTNPEQWTRGLAAYVLPGGGLVTLPFGAKNGMQLRAVLEQDPSGDYTLEFPFTIDGL